MSEDRFEKNLALVGHITNIFFSSLEPKGFYDYKDLFQEGSIGLFKACKKFDETKQIKFSTFAGTCIRNEILMFIRAERRKVVLIRLDEPVIGNEDESIFYIDMIYDRKVNVESELLANDFKTALDKSLAKDKRQGVFEEREKAVFSLMLKGYRQVDIMEELNISQRTASSHYKNIKYRLRNYYSYAK